MMAIFKRIMGLCLCLVLLASFWPGQVQAATETAVSRSFSFAGVKGPTLVKQNGVWYYVKNGNVCYDTTLVKFSGSWYYVKNGTTQPGLTTLVKYNGEWWYVVNGKVASNTTSLVKYNGEWWYVVKGKIASNTTSLVKYNGEWWYVVKGKIAAKTSTLVKYNDSWWYVQNGKVAKTTTLVPYAGKWYYVKNGKTHPTATTLVKYQGLWFYVKNGVMSNATTLCTFNGQRYYVRDGIAMTDYTGFSTVGSKQYYVRNGVVVCDIAGHGIWKALPEKYRCGSRAYYGTDLYLNSNGSFTGTFAEEIYEVSDEENYDITVYICNFHGQFSLPKKVGPYIYEVKVTSLTVDEKPGQVYYDEYGQKCITISEHDEIKKGDVFQIYLPGIPIDEAPGALNWYFSGYDNVLFVPDGYASLYNQRIQSDFFGIADWAAYS